jgi:hypothetical protein
MGRTTMLSAAPKQIAGLSQDDWNSIGWRDYLMWAMSERRMIDAFNTDTGRHYCERGGNPSDAQLAEDTEAFVLWVTENHWGMDYAPLSYQTGHRPR